MATRGIDTILLITPDRLVRADFRGRRRPVLASLRQEPPPAVEDLPSLVEAALRLSARRPGRVWVLSTEFWTQTLSLSPEAVAGVDAEQLRRALGFEAEPFSGLSALEATVSYRALHGKSGQRPFWLTQVARSVLANIEEIVEHAGGRLAGLRHPGGLSRPICAARGEGDSPSSWQRVELWPNSLLWVRGGSGVELAVEMRNVPPQSPRWQADVERWRSEAAPALHGEVLLAAKNVSRSELPDENCVVLDDEASLRQFLETWGRALGEEAAAPAICPPKRPMSATSRKLLATAAALVALVLCLGHHLWLEQRKTNLVVQTDRLKQPADKLAQLNKQTEALKKQHEELRAGVETLKTNLEECGAATAAHRQRLSALLTVLVQQSHEQMVIRRIAGTVDEIVVHGACLNHDLADKLAGALDREVGPLGWQVELVDKQSKDLLVAGGPWEFSLRIKDQGTLRLRQAVVAAHARSLPEGK